MMKKQTGGKRWKNGLLRGGLIALAAVTLLCGTYFATLAYLNESTQPVKNAFAGTGLVEEESDFYLKEKEPSDSAGDGVYDYNSTDTSLSDATVQGMTYLYVPGVTLQKRPYVGIENLQQHAYLFIKYSGLVEDYEKLQWKLEDYWTLVENESSELVYVYTGDKALQGDNEGILVSGNSYEIDLIANDSVTVSHEIYDISEATNLDFTMYFTAYLVQATGFENYQTAWSATYGG